MSQAAAAEAVPAIQVRNFTKAFGKVVAVDNISFDVNAGEILVIVGASGCGKTTTLRCIAGLERPTVGTISVYGRTVASDDVFVPPERRDIGMVFQSYALWPHKTVFQNVAYGLVVKKTPAAQVRQAVARVLGLVNLQGFEERYPHELSGGQQQRVALARSVVAEPKVLLLDEPLSNLDAKLREQMRGDVRRLVKELNITTLHITHDQIEAMAIADRIIYMNAGRIEQHGSPRDLYHRPASASVADFIGSANFLSATADASRPDRLLLKVNDELRLLSGSSWTGNTGDRVALAIRPESVSLSMTRLDGENVFAGTITEESFHGGYTEYRVRSGPIELVSHERGEFSVGTPVYVSISPQAVIPLPPDR